MTTEQLEQLDFVIDALSQSTNARHTAERAEILMGLRVAKTLAILTPHPADPPTGVRWRFSDDHFFAAMKDKTSELYQSLDTAGVQHTFGRDSNDGGRIYVDVLSN